MGSPLSDALDANDHLYRKVQTLDKDKRALRNALEGLRNSNGCFCDHVNGFRPPGHTSHCELALKVLKETK